LDRRPQIGIGQDDTQQARQIKSNKINTFLKFLAFGAPPDGIANYLQSFDKSVSIRSLNIPPLLDWQI